MRNPLKRRPRNETKPTLRERLTATKEKYARTLRVHHALNDPLPAPAPAPDRIALVNYASWLFMERRMVCGELYPHLGHRAATFVIAANAADRFHFPGVEGFPSGKPAAEKASARAVKVLDMVGVDWRSDLDDRDDLDNPARHDTGERPAEPSSWPRLDAVLLDALDDLNRLDAAQAVMGTAGRGGERDADTVPGYAALEDARSDALARLGKDRAESLIGLQAKAKALLTPSVEDMGGAEFDRIAVSLARDLLGARSHTIEPRPDPIFAAIEECERLEAVCAADYAKGNTGDSTNAQAEAARAATDHWRDVVLKTVPRTGGGCVALARFAPGYFVRWGISLDDPEGAAVFALIARSPLL